MAGAMLEIATGERMTERILWPNSNKSLFREASSDFTLQNWLQAYPNPSHGECYLTYKIQEGVVKAEIQLFNSAGSLIQQMQLGNNQNGICEVSKNLPAGVYEATMFWDGVAIQSIKIVFAP